MTAGGPHVRTTRPSPRSGRLDILILEACGVRFALPCCAVEETLTGISVRRTPFAPETVEGVFAHGTSWVPVLDVPGRVGRRGTTPRPTDHLVLARAGERLVAFRSERETSASHVPLAELEAGGALPAREQAAGTLALANGVILIQAPRALLSEADAAELDVALSFWGSAADQA